MGEESQYFQHFDEFMESQEVKMITLKCKRSLGTAAAVAHDTLGYMQQVLDRVLERLDRIFQPGCKNDTCFVLEGPQRLLKSAALRTLAHPWFTDEIADLGTKDAALQVRGVWIIELAEFGRGQRRKMEAISYGSGRLGITFFSTVWGTPKAIL